MSDSTPSETSTGGTLGRVVGKAKAAVGSVLGDDDLKREGHLQDAAGEAQQVAAREAEEAEQRRKEAEVVEQRANAAAERDRLKAELEAEDRKAAIERDESQAEVQADVDTMRAETKIADDERLQQCTADAIERAAIRERAEASAEAARLERAAAGAEQTADVIDPEDKTR